MSDLKIKEKTFDVKEVFKKKNPVVARFVPGFVYKYLRRIIHEEEGNVILYRNRDKFGVDFVNACLDDLQANLNIHGLENIPKTGKCILISNHPLGGFDGLALMKTVGKIRRDLYFLANDILMFLPNLKPLFVPINKHGSSKDYINSLNKAFEEDNLILIFPAGLVSRKIDGKIQDLEWKNTFLSRAKRNKRDIIPVYVGGRNTNWFYNLANWRKKLGIKANLEMFYLVDELFKQKGKKLDIYIGKPIPYQTFDNRKKGKEWIKSIREFVYGLKDNPDKEFTP